MEDDMDKKELINLKCRKVLRHRLATRLGHRAALAQLGAPPVISLADPRLLLGLAPPQAVVLPPAVI